MNMHLFDKCVSGPAKELTSIYVLGSRSSACLVKLLLLLDEMLAQVSSQKKIQGTLEVLLCYLGDHHAYILKK
jgi:hypothetical protein